MSNAFSCNYSFKHIRAVSTLSVKVLKVVSLKIDLVSSFLKKGCLQVANIKAFFFSLCKYIYFLSTIDKKNSFNWQKALLFSK